MEKSYIILHHSVTKDGVLRDFDAIKNYHIKHNGWRDIGYQWVVERVNGKLIATPGRAEWDTGAHCPGHNGDSIGICVVGDFTNMPPDEETYIFVANLCKDIMTRHPIQEIGGHRDYYATACPGNMFDVQHVKDLVQAKEKPMPEQWKVDIMTLAKKEGLIMGDHRPEDPAPKWFVLAVELNMVKVLRGGK